MNKPSLPRFEIGVRNLDAELDMTIGAGGITVLPHAPRDFGRTKAGRRR